MATLDPEPLRRSDSDSQRVEAPDPDPPAEPHHPRRRRSARVFAEPEPLGGYPSHRRGSGRQDSFGPSFSQSPPPGAYATRDYPAGPSIGPSFSRRYGNAPVPDPAYYAPVRPGPYDYGGGMAYAPHRRRTWEDNREREERQKNREELIFALMAAADAARGDRRRDSRSPRRSRRRRSRSPSIVRARRRRSYDGDSYYSSRASSSDESTYYEESDDGLNATLFEFKPSRASRSSPTENGEDSNDEHGPDRTWRESAASNKLDPRILHVYQSQYTGDAFLEGTHTISLTGYRPGTGTGSGSAQATVTSNTSRGEHKEPLFRWMHIRQEIMNFDSLSNDVTGLTVLSQSQRNGLTKLLAEVKKNCIKTKQTSKGNHVKYMEPRFIQVPIKPETSGITSSQRQTRSVSWFSIPYFALEKYSGLLSATDPTSFPPLTLLQAQYSRTVPQRDLDQVVCQLDKESASDGKCFHIAQLWCIVVDTSLLITCGTMWAKPLKGEAITIIPPEPPSSNGEGGGGLGRIYVSYSEAVLWSFALKDCRTWLDFLSHFYDFWPEAIQFLHHEKSLSEDDWNRIYHLAKHSSYKIILTLRLAPRPSPPPRGILKTVEPEESTVSEVPEDSRRRRRSRNPPSISGSQRHSTSQHRQDNKFHVFSWLDNDPDSVPRTAHGQTLPEPAFPTLSDIKTYLMAETKPTDKIAYRDCPKANRRSLFEYLQQEGLRIEEQSAEDRRRKQQYEQRVDILNAADTVFQFYLPIGVYAPTATRYWGAVRALIQMSSQPQGGGGYDRQDDEEEDVEDVNVAATKSHVPAVRSFMRDAARRYQHIQNLMGQVHPDSRAKVVIPDGLVKSWIHTLMGLIYATQDSQVWEEHLEEAARLVSQGLDEIAGSLIGHGELLKQSAILPLEIVSLVSIRLLQDVTYGAPSISGTYSEYLESLEANITTKPSDRLTQHKISLLKQEIAVIKKTVASQTGIFAAIVASLPKWQSSSGRDVTISTPNKHSHSRSRSAVEPIVDTVNRHSRHKSFTAVANKGTYVSRLPEEVAGRWPSDYEPRGESYNDEERYYSSHHHRTPRMDTSVLNPDEFYKLSPTHPGGFRELLAVECGSFLERRMRDFEEYDYHASVLEDTNANKIDTTKDRQEMAIYAFTIVTIIFLPLSSVAGIFGMNTADIRDMDLGQWAYWAAAIPVTVVVIVLGLWWMGELGNALAWILRRPVRGGQAAASGAGAYAIIPPYVAQSPMMPPPPPPPPAGYWPGSVPIQQPFPPRPLGYTTARRHRSYYEL